jgi:hypothetical protein
VVSSRDRRRFGLRYPTASMEDSDLLGVVLAGIALLMFVTGIVLVM